MTAHTRRALHFLRAEAEAAVGSRVYDHAVDHLEQSRALREELSSEQRLVDGYLGIDPGFVHQRKIETIVGRNGMEVIDRRIKELPDLADWQRAVRIDHIYTQFTLDFCRALEVPTLGGVLARGRGHLFCSVEHVAACLDIYDAERVVTTVGTPGFDDHEVELRFASERVTSDTVKSRLHDGDEHAIIAQFRAHRDGVLMFEPLVIGAPWLYSASAVLPEHEAMWWSRAIGEVFVEDIAEFARAAEVDISDDWLVMGRISEAAVKACFADLLGEDAPKDWGGEQSDLYSSRIHLNGDRRTAAFLLKGPGNSFRPMKLNHLGKNNDQIVRLSKEPADLLVVQHAHDIEPAVRDTLRAFAMQPGPIRRRYCLIDGKDSFRILKAYGLLERALELSKAGQAP